MSSRATSQTLRSSKDDHTTETFFSVASALKTSKEDIGIVILAVIIILLCLLACLLSYFLVLNQQQYDSATVLASLQTTAINNVQVALATNVAYMQSLANFFQYTIGSVNFTTQFIPLVYAQGFPAILSGVYYGARVLNADKAAFTQSLRAEGGIYTNFTIHYEYVPPGTPIPYYQPYTAAEYYPILMSVSPVPGYTGAFIGWDWFQVPENVNAIIRMNSTLQPTLTAATVIPSGPPAPNTPQIIIFETVALLVPVLNTTTNTVQAFVSGSLFLNTLISNALNSTVLNDIYYAIYDTNTTDGNGGLVYSSNQYYNNTDVMAIINSAPYNLVQTFSYVDRTYSAVFAPTPQFISNNSNFMKYVGIIVSIIISLVLLTGCIVLFFLNKLRRSIALRKKSKKHLQSLTETYQKTQSLLTRLANQESKTRAAFNSIPQFIIVLNSNGKILQTNKVFDRLFGFSEETLQKGMYINTIFTKLESNFFNNATYLSTNQESTFLHVVATSNEGKDIPVSISIKKLEEESTEQTNAVPSPVSELESPSDIEVEEGEAFTVVGEPIAKEETNRVINLLNR
jgi:PAS domain S-box-containing protein